MCHSSFAASLRARGRRRRQRTLKGNLRCNISSCWHTSSRRSALQADSSTVCSRAQHAMTPRCLLCLLAALLEATTSSSAFGRLSSASPIVCHSPSTLAVAPPAPREASSDAPSARGLNLTPVFPMLDSTLGVLSYLAFGVYIIMLFIDILGKKDPLRSAALLLKRYQARHLFGQIVFERSRIQK
ncbi:uncharacterized protein LOC125034328 [Penaeus chinensis]|uniref:uncharacterized protein LOC125034328 n=1 Tax=Penaeus chinensis TaxID=139456 RepID=UPI001FB63093|nr:uncharacterized protein LOC125034328 [Penaeus chinensis]